MIRYHYQEQSARVGAVTTQVSVFPILLRVRWLAHSWAGGTLGVMAQGRLEQEREHLNDFGHPVARVKRRVDPL